MKKTSSASAGAKRQPAATAAFDSAEVLPLEEACFKIDPALAMDPVKFKSLLSSAFKEAAYENFSHATLVEEDVAACCAHSKAKANRFLEKKLADFRTEVFLAKKPKAAAMTAAKSPTLAAAATAASAPPGTASFNFSLAAGTALASLGPAYQTFKSEVFRSASSFFTTNSSSCGGSGVKHRDLPHFGGAIGSNSVSCAAAAAFATNVPTAAQRKSGASAAAAAALKKDAIKKEKAIVLEKEKVREFWLSLSKDERQQLVFQEKHVLLKMWKEKQKLSCACAYCVKKKRLVEDEIQMLYDTYFEVLEEYTRFLAEYRRLGIKIPSDEFPDFGQVFGKSHSVISLANANTALKYGLINVAEDLLKNQGRKFLEILDRIAERKLRREIGDEDPHKPLPAAAATAATSHAFRAAQPPFPKPLNSAAACRRKKICRNTAHHVHEESDFVENDDLISTLSDGDDEPLPKAADLAATTNSTFNDAYCVPPVPPKRAVDQSPAVLPFAAKTAHTQRLCEEDDYVDDDALNDDDEDDEDNDQEDGDGTATIDAYSPFFDAQVAASPFGMDVSAILHEIDGECDSFSIDGIKFDDAKSSIHFADAQNDDEDDEDEDGASAESDGSFSSENICSDCEQENEDEQLEDIFYLIAAMTFEQRVFMAYKEHVALENQKKLLQEVEESEKMAKEKKTSKQAAKQAKKERQKQQKHSVAQAIDASKAFEESFCESDDAAEVPGLKNVTPPIQTHVPPPVVAKTVAEVSPPVKTKGKSSSPPASTTLKAPSKKEEVAAAATKKPRSKGVEVASVAAASKPATASKTEKHAKEPKKKAQSTIADEKQRAANKQESASKASAFNGSSGSFTSAKGGSSNTSKGTSPMLNGQTDNRATSKNSQSSAALSDATASKSTNPIAKIADAKQRSEAAANVSGAATTSKKQVPTVAALSAQMPPKTAMEDATQSSSSTLPLQHAPSLPGQFFSPAYSVEDACAFFKGSRAVESTAAFHCTPPIVAPPPGIPTAAVAAASHRLAPGVPIASSRLPAPRADAFLSQPAPSSDFFDGAENVTNDFARSIKNIDPIGGKASNSHKASALSDANWNFFQPSLIPEHMLNSCFAPAPPANSDANDLSFGRRADEDDFFKSMLEFQRVI